MLIKFSDSLLLSIRVTLISGLEVVEWKAR